MNAQRPDLINNQHFTGRNSLSLRELDNYMKNNLPKSMSEYIAIGEKLEDFIQKSEHFANLEKALHSKVRVEFPKTSFFSEAEKLNTLTEEECLDFHAKREEKSKAEREAKKECGQEL